MDNACHFAHALVADQKKIITKAEKMDWTVNNAIIALTYFSQISCEIEYEVSDLFLDLADKISGQSHCYEHTLVYYALQLPNLPAQIRQFFALWLMRLEKPEKE